MSHTVRFPFHLTDEQSKMLEELAERNYQTKSDIIRGLIEVAHDRDLKVYRRGGKWCIDGTL